MAVNYQDLEDREFFLAALSDYAVGQLPKDQRRRFKDLLSDPSFKSLYQKYQALRLKWQGDLQTINLKVGEQEWACQPLVAHSKREPAELAEFFSRQKKHRRLLIAVIVLIAVVALIGFSSLFPKNKPQFSPLDILVHEATQLMSGGRQPYFNARSNEDLMRYLTHAHKQLGFFPTIEVPKGSLWQIAGVSLRSFGTVKALEVYFQKPGTPESVVLFIHQRAFDPSLPPVKLGALASGQAFRGYGNSQASIITWENDVTRNYLVGELSIKDIADAASQLGF